LGSGHQAVEQRNEQADSDTFGQRSEQPEHNDRRESPLVESEERYEAPDRSSFLHGSGRRRELPSWLNAPAPVSERASEANQSEFGPTPDPVNRLTDALALVLSVSLVSTLLSARW
jgi:hypothetical protein